MFFGKKRDKLREFLRLVFGVRARNIDLYKMAVMHRSSTMVLEDGRRLNNERLEFLGDAVLEAVVSDYLYIEFPDATEGELTKLRSKIVSRQTMNGLAEDIGLMDHVVSHTGGLSRHIAGDALEAVIGAMYLDQGYNRVNRALINSLLRDHLDIEEIVSEEVDYKSRLLEYCQKSRQKAEFETTEHPRHTARIPVFESVITIDGTRVGSSVGETKKQAEQNVARVVYMMIGDEASDQFLESIDQAARDLGAGR